MLNSFLAVHRPVASPQLAGPSVADVQRSHCPSALLGAMKSVSSMPCGCASSSRRDFLSRERRRQPSASLLSWARPCWKPRTATSSTAEIRLGKKSWSRRGPRTGSATVRSGRVTVESPTFGAILFCPEPAGGSERGDSAHSLVFPATPVCGRISLEPRESRASGRSDRLSLPRPRRIGVESRAVEGRTGPAERSGLPVCQGLCPRSSRILSQSRPTTVCRPRRTRNGGLA